MKSDFSTFAYGKLTDFPKTTQTNLAVFGITEDMINVIEPITYIHKVSDIETDNYTGL